MVARNLCVLAEQSTLLASFKAPLLSRGWLLRLSEKYDDCREYRPHRHLPSSHNRYWRGICSLLSEENLRRRDRSMSLGREQIEDQLRALPEALSGGGTGRCQLHPELFQHPRQPVTRAGPLIVAAMIALALPGALSAREYRSREVTREFQGEHPCSSTGLRTGACPGYRKDHIKALACGGPDAVWNMQWQTIRDARAKDRWELRVCGSVTEKSDA